MEHASSTGYLKDDFRVFKISDCRKEAIKPHYHSFDKVVILLSGEVDYSVEGRDYKLTGGDILFVPHNTIHKVTMNGLVNYDRIILWINPEFLSLSGSASTDLSLCFRDPSGSAMVRASSGDLVLFSWLTDDILSNINIFGMDLIHQADFIRFMTRLNQIYISSDSRQAARSVENRKIIDVLDYLNDHISENITVDTIASEFFISKYHFMRKFKEITGMTVHGYINQKRLSAAAEYLVSGRSPQEVCSMTGFGDYSSFLRAFKRAYGLSPREYSRNSPLVLPDIRTDKKE